MTTEKAAKFTVGELHTAYATLTQIVREHQENNVKVPSKAAYWIARMLKRLEAEFVPAEERRIALIKEYGEESDGGITVRADKLQEFSEKWAEVCAVESDIVPLKVKIDILDGVEMTPQQMILIEKFVEE